MSVSPVKRIYITHEKGLDGLAPYIAEAIKEVMDSFPKSKRYQEYFPIENLGDWKESDYRFVKNGQIQYKPYKSIAWYIDRAQKKAVEQGRWQTRGQISIGQLYDDLKNDPYAQKYPQFSILVTSHDLYGTGSDGRLLNFCNGVSKEGRFSIVSTARFKDRNGNLDIERFKSVVMHEFGHLIGLTPNGRKNTYEQLGTHCSNGDIMAQDMSGTGRKMTYNRLLRKNMGLPPICSDCIEAGCRFLDREIYNAASRRGNQHDM